MEYCIENEYLRLRVSNVGAQIESLIRKSDGVEHIWCGDARVWGFSAPILFPYTGRIKDGKLIIRGKTVENAPMHGLVRTAQYDLVEHDAERLVLSTRENERTLAVFPYRFRLVCEFSLKGESLCQRLTVVNTDEERFSFGIGFHPGFAIPFDEHHCFDDYELRFSEPQSPICVETPQGLCTDVRYCLAEKIASLPVSETLFDGGSHCMLGLSAETLGIYEKDSKRAVVCRIAGYPYCLIWSQPGVPHFVCIEPWHSLPDREDSHYRWEQKPAAATIEPGEQWSTELWIETVR